MPRKIKLPNRKTWPALAELLDEVTTLHEDAMEGKTTPGEELDAFLEYSFEAFKALGISEDRIRSYMKAPYPLRDGPKPPIQTFDPIPLTATAKPQEPAAPAKSGGLGSIFKGN